jgi:hypothetical protein
MTTYTVSYFIKNPTKFEEGATVTEMGNGWLFVVKTFEGWSLADAMEHTKSLEFPIGSMMHTLSLVPLISAKPKRKATWKQNPLQRFAPRSKA